MINQPKISVITIVYNGERYIRETIDSILNQTYNDFEYIIVENNSTDNTPEILKYYAQKDKRIKIIKESQQGILYARKTGLQAAKGEWIAVLDADDIAYSCRLESQMDYIRANPKTTLVGGGSTEIDENGIIIRNYVYPSDQKSLVDRLVNMRGFFAHSSAFFKRRAAVELGGYQLLYAEDNDLWLRMSLLIGNISSVRKPLVKIRVSNKSHSYTVSQEEYLLYILVGQVRYYRQKKGYPYLSPEDGILWFQFLEWTKTRMNNLDVINKRVALRKLKSIRYSREQNLALRLTQIASLLITNQYARAFLIDRSYLRNAAIKIADESLSIFPKP